MATNRANALTRIARLPGRRAPLKGWRLVTEVLHRRINPADTDVVHKSVYGVRLRLDLNDYIQRGIYYDAWETHELNFAEAALRGGDVFIDVGANVGIFTLVAARRVGDAGVVHSFEPVPANFSRLSENVALNGFTNVQLNEAAAGAEPGELLFGLETEMADESGAAMSGFYTAGASLRQVAAPVVRLDDYLAAQNDDRRVRLIKIDVEGYEPKVLEGLRQSLANKRVDIVMLEVSVYALAHQGARVIDIVRPLQDAGYRLFRIGLGGALRRWTYRREPTIPRRDLVERGLIYGIYKGLQDLERNFNLVAVRGDHPARLDDR